MDSNEFSGWWGEMAQIVEYDELDGALRRIDALPDAAECHGILCGMLCEQGSVDQENWIRQVLGEYDSADALVAETVGVLRRVYAVTMEQINDTELGFRLLLPEEDAGLEQAVAALSEWCQGFLFGFNLNGGRSEENTPEDVRDVMEDMVEISRVDIDVEGEEDESSFTEVAEYVRMGVLLILEELHPMRVTTRMQ
jgi:yecA family protein